MKDQWEWTCVWKTENKINYEKNEHKNLTHKQANQVSKTCIEQVINVCKTS